MIRSASRLGNSQKLFKTWVLVLLSILVFLLSYQLTKPGLIWGPDLNEQLAQARGERAFYDWHPVILAVIWRLLMSLTGSLSSLLILELICMNLGFALIATVAYYRHRINYFCAVLIVLLPFFPPLLVKWPIPLKDIFLANLVVLAFALLWVGKQGKYRWPCAIFAIICASLAILSRGNGIFLLPGFIALLTVRLKPTVKSYWPAFKRPLLLAVTLSCLLFLLIFGGLRTAVNTYAQPIKTHQINQLFLDDIVFTASQEDLKELQVSDQFKQELLQIQQRCLATKQRSNILWGCAKTSRIEDPQNKVRHWPFLDRHNDQFASAWWQVVTEHPLSYLQYRTEIFKAFSFETWQPHLDISNSKISIPPANQRPQSAAWPALVKFTDSFIRFVPQQLGLWALAALILLLSCRWFSKDKEIQLFVSSFLVAVLGYYIGHFPIVPVPDYRYGFPWIMAVCVSLLLLLGAKLGGSRGN